jgi:MFS transporter, Spinster family, sphingosine-1-phosphate transporter
MSTAPGAVPSPVSVAPKVSAPLALTLLVLINLFNYIDRQVLAAVEPEIRRELLVDAAGAEIEQAKYWTGWFATAFLVSYMLMAPLFGLMADRFSRWGLVGFGVVLWSLASGASGLDWLKWGMPLATAYWLLLLTRCFVGIGEAAYGPVAPAMIADLYPVEKRGQVMAWFYLAIPVGGALGYALGEAVKNWINWHYAFYFVVPPGLALGVWCFLMRDPPRGQTDHVSATPARKPRLADYLFLLRNRSYLLNTLGMTMMTFAIGGLAYWMPEYLDQSKAPDVGPLGPRTVFGGITALAGLISTLAGGLAGDWLRPRFSGSYFLVSGFALILGFPMILLVLWAAYPLKWLFIFLTVFLLFFNTGPTNTILANVVHPSMRASGFALNILIIHALGDAISPPLIGFISGKDRLDLGFMVVSLSMLLGGVFWLLGVKHLQGDTGLAPTRLPP